MPHKLQDKAVSFGDVDGGQHTLRAVGTHMHWSAHDNRWVDGLVLERHAQRQYAITGPFGRVVVDYPPQGLKQRKLMLALVILPAMGASVGK